MKTDYASNNNEIRAHELLAPLIGACPDSVWETISAELEAQRLKAKNKLKDKLKNLPRVPLVVAGSVVIITISAWAFFNHKSVSHKNIVSSAIPVKQVAAKTVGSNNNNVAIQPVAAIKISNTVPTPQPEVNSTQVVDETAKAEKHKRNAEASNNISAVQNLRPVTDNKDDGIVDIQASNNSSPAASTHHSDSLTNKAVNPSSDELPNIADNEK